MTATMQWQRDEQTSQRAFRAVREMNKLLPMFQSVARALSGVPDLEVRLTAGTPCTNGKIIHLRPPIELGDVFAHDRANCSRRDEKSHPVCPACRQRERVLSTFYHELAHIISDSFQEIQYEDKIALLASVLNENPGATGTRLAKIQAAVNHANSLPRWEANYMGIASMVSPFLPILINALEDARVNKAMYEVRAGTFHMFRSKIIDTFENGVESLDGTTFHWANEDENGQAIIGCLVKASDVEPQDGYLSEPVLAALRDNELSEELAVAADSSTAADIYRASFRVLEHLRRLGFCRRPEDAQDDPPPTPEPEQEKNDEQEADDPADTGESEESMGSGAPEQDDSANADPDDSEAESSDESTDDTSADPEPGSGSIDWDDDEQHNDELGNDAGDGSDDSDDNDESSDNDDNAERDSSVPEVRDDAKSDLDAEPETGSESEESDGEDDDDSSEDSEGTADGSSDDDSGENAEDSSVDEATGEGDESDDSDDAEAGESADGEADDDLDDDLDDDQNDTDASELGDTDSESEDAARAADERMEDSDPDAVSNLLKIFGGHDIDSAIPDRTDKVLEKAIVQAEQFDEASNSVNQVNVHQFDKPNYRSQRLAWAVQNPDNDPSRFAEPSDFEMPESMIGPALLKMRVIFSENKKAKPTGERRSGKIVNHRLATVMAGNTRVFAKPSKPGKKDYFVLLALDVSGSTMHGQRLENIKKMGFSFGNLLNRAGVKFAIYAHTGSILPTKSGDYDDRYEADVFVIKEENGPWDERAKQRLAVLNAAGNNLDGHALEFFRKRCDQSSATDKIILYVTDGRMPEANKDDERAVLVREIRECDKRKYALVGVGIGTDSPRTHGLDTIRIDQTSDIHKLISELEKRLAVKL